MRSKSSSQCHKGAVTAMSFSEQDFVRLRRYLYHTTVSNNLVRVRQTGQLDSAAALAHRCDGRSLSNERRLEAQSLNIAGDTPWLQTQRPLRTGNTAFENGYTIEDLVSVLNGKVFFWPGTERGMSKYGERHKTKNVWPDDAAPVTLRIGTGEAFAISRPSFCRFNSGAPRTYFGRKSPRGPRTFLPADSFAGNPGDVVEVVFDQTINLPDSTQILDEEHGIWVPLFD